MSDLISASSDYRGSRVALKRRDEFGGSAGYLGPDLVVCPALSHSGRNRRKIVWDTIRKIVSNARGDC